MSYLVQRGFPNGEVQSWTCGTHTQARAVAVEQTKELRQHGLSVLSVADWGHNEYWVITAKAKDAPHLKYSTGWLHLVHVDG